MFAVSWESRGRGIQGVSADIVFRCVALACVLTDLVKKQRRGGGKKALCACEMTS